MRPSAHSSARSASARDIAAMPAGVTARPPSGSRMSQSKPADTSTNSGANWRQTGTTTSSKARSNSRSPKPAGNGRVGGRPPPPPPPPPAEGAPDPATAEARRERQVERPPRARALPDLVHRAGARIVGILMGRHVEHAGIVLEEMLRAVAGVQVPVDEEHARDAALPQVGGRDGDVVEEAEPHGPRALRVMAGRPHQRDAVPHLAGEHRLAQVDQPAGGQTRRLPRAR